MCCENLILCPAKFPQNILQPTTKGISVNWFHDLLCLGWSATKIIIIWFCWDPHDSVSFISCLSPVSFQLLASDEFPLFPTSFRGKETHAMPVCNVAATASWKGAHSPALPWLLDAAAIQVYWVAHPWWVIKKKHSKPAQYNLYTPYTQKKT